MTPLNDWTTRGGEQLDPQIRFDFDDFYPTYVDAWRITQGESLFYYDSGGSTDTFMVEGFPRSHLDLAEMDPDLVADAEAPCREGGIERPEMLDACTLDLAMTGDHRFVYHAYIVHSSTAGAAEPVCRPSARQGDNVVTVGPLSVGFGAEPPLVLTNSSVQWECQAAEGSLFATSRFLSATDNSNKVTIQYLAAATSPTGDEFFTFIVEIDGQEVAWMAIPTQPANGSLDSVTLDGSTLTASGTALLNQPLDRSLHPGSALPAGTPFVPFTLQVNCDR